MSTKTLFIFIFIWLYILGHGYICSYLIGNRHEEGANRERKKKCVCEKKIDIKQVLILTIGGKIELLNDRCYKSRKDHFQLFLLDEETVIQKKQQQ